MWQFIKHILYCFLYYWHSKQTRQFIQRITRITGSMPYNIALYKLACLHVSQKQKSELTKDHKSNERLEFLGDAVLNTVIGHYLFKKFPLENEGFLTEIRARLVNRNALNNLATKIGLTDLIVFQQNPKNTLNQFQSISGNTLEALVGAVYLDKGAVKCEQFILQNLLKPHINIKETIDTPQNYKSILMQWGQQQNKNIRFETNALPNTGKMIGFVTNLYINDKIIMSAQDRSKKKSEQLVAQKAYNKLIKGKIWEKPIPKNPENVPTQEKNHTEKNLKTTPKKSIEKKPKQDIPNVKVFVKKQEINIPDFQDFEQINEQERQTVNINTNINTETETNKTAEIEEAKNIAKKKKKKKFYKKRSFNILKNDQKPLP